MHHLEIFTFEQFCDFETRLVIIQSLFDSPPMTFFQYYVTMAFAVCCMSYKCPPVCLSRFCLTIVLADRTNGRAYATVLRLSVCRRL